MTCQHDTIITWRDEAANPVTWSCMDCGRKFVPLTQQLIDDEDLLRQALDRLEYAYDHMPLLVAHNIEATMEAIKERLND